ncbi:MAG: S1 family peptidase [Planctomycetota bacterium]
MSATGYECPLCRAQLTVRLEPGEVCPDCRSADAWHQYGGRKLVIGREDLAAAAARRRGDVARPLSWAHLLSVAAGIGVVLSILATMGNFTWARLAPLDVLQENWLGVARWTVLAGLATLAAGGVAIVRLRRSRSYRSAPLIGLNLTATVVGTAALVLGGVYWLYAVNLFGWQHVSVPPLSGAAARTPLTRSIMDATTVILAPDGDGDARGMAIGSGAVISAAGDRAWVVTCRHVAMPYAATAAFRDVARAHPVWVYFSDGRSAPGRVSWTAQPPLDVAIVSVAIENPPAPVPISPDAGAVGADARVCFVPNPFRTGWRAHHGRVLKREPHRTPAGEYSLFLTDLPVLPGDSGTGLFDHDGRLVGLNFYLRSDEGRPQVISLPAETMDRVRHLISGDALERLDRR